LEYWRMGAVLEHLFVFGHADSFCDLPPFQRIHSCRFELFGSQACQQPHDRRLFVLLIFMADGWLECILELLLNLGNPHSVRLLPPFQWQHGLGFELLRNQACQHPDGCQLLGLLLLVAGRKLGCFFKHLLILGNADPFGLLSP